MRHVTLTCVNHPTLRWSCKEITVNKIGQYTGARHIFFLGEHNNGDMWKECECKPNDLRFAPEELERQKTEPLEN